MTLFLFKSHRNMIMTFQLRSWSCIFLTISRCLLRGFLQAEDLPCCIRISIYEFQLSICTSNHLCIGIPMNIHSLFYQNQIVIGKSTYSAIELYFLLSQRIELLEFEKLEILDFPSSIFLKSQTSFSKLTTHFDSYQH